MFIPTVKTNIIIGDKVILKEDISISYGILTKGHILTVVEKTNEWYNLIDDNGIILKNINKKLFNKLLSIGDAKTINEKNIKHYNLIKLIEKNCKQRTFNYDEYERYDSCKLKKKHNRLLQ